jgi:preprotein translocase subunit SecY
MNALTSLVCRVLFVGAFALAALALGEKLANLAGYTVLRGAIGAGRLLEISGIALLFVVALQLREIAHTLKAKASG